jgi:phage portal protein BeeE
VTVGLLERISPSRAGTDIEARSTIDQYISEYLLPSQFSYGGNTYPFGSAVDPRLGLSQTLSGNRAQQFTSDLPGHAAAVVKCPPAFAAQMVRALVLSQARFTFRGLRSSKTPGKLFGNRDLGVLERPWRNATTGELLARMEWSAGLGGNAFVTNWARDRLRVLRPDWTGILFGSELEPDDPSHALDGDVLGYVYCNGGFHSGNRVRTLTPDQVAHWSPLPDPLNAGLGMSWITPAIREIQGDQLATQHKIKFFENGATPNLVVKGIPAVTREQFTDIVDMLESNHAGVANAYRTLYLTAGADATVVGSDLKQIDFKQTQGAGETRLSVLSRVPAPLLGISEGLAGSSLNAGNFGMARRMFADTWVYPSLQDVAAALAPLVKVPDDAELWFDPSDMPILREDAKDAADIEQIKATTIVSYVREGFTPESAIAAVQGQDVKLLKHTGLVSVQLQPIGTVMAPKLPKQVPAVESPARSDADLERAHNDEQLHHYWTKGEGLAKWVGSPHPWTTLMHHLEKHVDPERAKRMAAQWHHEVFGIWPGEKAGSNPAGPG